MFLVIRNSMVNGVVKCWCPRRCIDDLIIYAVDGGVQGGKDDRVRICVAEVWEYDVDHVVNFPGDVDMPNFNLV